MRKEALRFGLSWEGAISSTCLKTGSASLRVLASSVQRAEPCQVARSPEPYGSDNREPLYLADDLRVAGEPRKVGKDERHLSFKVRQDNTVMKTIAFGMSDRVAGLMLAGGTLKINSWNDHDYVNLVVEDLQAGGQASPG